jgi:hypothetical protein
MKVVSSAGVAVRDEMPKLATKFREPRVFSSGEARHIKAGCRSAESGDAHSSGIPNPMSLRERGTLRICERRNVTVPPGNVGILSLVNRRQLAELSGVGL